LKNYRIALQRAQREGTRMDFSGAIEKIDRPHRPLEEAPEEES